MKRLCRLLFTALLVHPVIAQPSESTRAEHLHQYASQLQSGINILMLSPQPGFEDPASLAFFRYHRGANVTSAYATNGGILPSDYGDEYPHLLAARRRQEAFNAMQAIGVEAYFMNLADVPAYADTARIWAVWSRDSLRLQILRLLRETKPDIILLTMDLFNGPGSVPWDLFKSELLSVVKRMNARTAPAAGKVYDLDDWHVDRVFAEDTVSNAQTVNTAAIHPFRKKDYRSLGKEAAAAYVSMRSYPWMQNHRTRTYSLALSSSKNRPKSIESGLPKSVAKVLSITQKAVNAIASEVKRDPKAYSITSRRTGAILNRVAIAIDSVGYHLKSTYAFLNPNDRRQLIHWKLALEDLRNVLLGASIQYQFSETVLTNAQLTYLTIDTVTGLDPNGSTELFFPEAKKAWIVNEKNQERWPLTLKERYRLISPFGLRYDLPAQEYGLERNTYGSPFTFYIIHGSSDRARNFALPVTSRFFYAPKFTVEVLTPIVRLVPGEKVAVRLTNHSRDGVADTLAIDHPLVRSSKHFFRLSTKESTFLDSLEFVEVQKGTEGSHIIPIQIGGEIVSHFGCRAFDVSVDSIKRIGLLTGYEQSALAQALRRLGLDWKLMKADSTLADGLSAIDVLFIDSRALTLLPFVSSHQEVLEAYVNRGGRVIIFGQDSFVWNQRPLVSGIRLVRATPYEENAAVDLVATDNLFSVPNPLSAQDWNEWLWMRTDQKCELESARFDIPARLQSDGTPLVVTRQEGQGRITYVNLALSPQFLNIHPGAFRLLANLLSY